MCFIQSYFLLFLQYSILCVIRNAGAMFLFRNTIRSDAFNSAMRFVMLVLTVEREMGQIRSARRW